MLLALPIWPYHLEFRVHVQLWPHTELPDNSICQFHNQHPKLFLPRISDSKNFIIAGYKKACVNGSCFAFSSYSFTPRPHHTAWQITWMKVSSIVIISLFHCNYQICSYSVSHLQVVLLSETRRENSRQLSVSHQKSVVYTVEKLFAAVEAEHLATEQKWKKPKA